MASSTLTTTFKLQPSSAEGLVVGRPQVVKPQAQTQVVRRLSFKTQSLTSTQATTFELKPSSAEGLVVGRLQVVKPQALTAPQTPKESHF